MGYPRPDSADGVVAGLVTGQVHKHPELPSVDHWHAAASRTFEHRDGDAPPTRFPPEAPGPSEPPHVFL